MIAKYVINSNIDKHSDVYATRCDVVHPLLISHTCRYVYVAGGVTEKEKKKQDDAAIFVVWPV